MKCFDTVEYSKIILNYECIHVYICIPINCTYYHMYTVYTYTSWHDIFYLYSRLFLFVLCCCCCCLMSCFRRGSPTGTVEPLQQSNLRFNQWPTKRQMNMNHSDRRKTMYVSLVKMPYIYIYNIFTYMNIHMHATCMNICPTTIYTRWWTGRFANEPHWWRMKPWSVMVVMAMLMKLQLQDFSGKHLLMPFGKALETWALDKLLHPTPQLQ